MHPSLNDLSAAVGKARERLDEAKEKLAAACARLEVLSPLIDHFQAMTEEQLSANISAILIVRESRDAAQRGPNV